LNIRLPEGDRLEIIPFRISEHDFAFDRKHGDCRGLIDAF